jgi:spore germination protein
MYKKQKDSPKPDFSLQLFERLDENTNNLKNMLDNPDDLVIREFTLGQNCACAIVYIDGLIDRDLVQNSLLESLQNIADSQDQPEEIEITTVFNDIYEKFVSITTLEKGYTLEDVSNAILSGNTTLYIDGMATVLLMDTMGGETRAIEQPETETLVRGPRVAFVENLGTNLSLLRRNIQAPNLRLKTHKIGRRSRKSLVVAYVDGIVNPALLKEVDRRLKTMDMDDAPESGYIEQYIEDSFLSPFPQTLDTERPDRVAASLLQGKVAILTGGTPIALIVPITMGDIFKSPEDYYERWFYTTLLRVLRYFGAFLALFLPGLYISLASFHSGLLPSKLAFSIAASREGVPFPPVFEAISMIVTLELLQEAGIRLPTPIGQTIGIVGGLVIGEAAVQAGIVSPVMVIVIGLTAIAAYTTPAFSFGISLRILRFAFMIAAAAFGLYGVILVYIMINIHIVNLTSFGVPYATPYAPTMLRDLKDLILRAPRTMLTKRQEQMQTEDPTAAANKGEQES